MNKIIIGGAGGAPSEGVIKSLLKSAEKEEVIGMGSVVADLVLSNAKRRYVVPYADDEEYRDKLIKILSVEKPSLLHVQNDLEVYKISLLREDILSLGTKLFMPSHEVVENCVYKYRSWKSFKKAGIIVPENIYINDEKDLKRAFRELGNENGEIWLRADSIGGGGIGSIPTNDYEMARAWINRYNGWRNFIAAQMLTSETITFLSIWWEGELVVAQTRKRAGWIHANRAVSGVTGVTKVGVTWSDDKVTDIALKSIKAVDEKPHGIFGVDMTYDKEGIPNPTEINISRFFTTILFFTEAGLNMPVIFKDLILYHKFPKLKRKINPLPDGLHWFRAMDKLPVLLTNMDVEKRLTRL